MAKVLRSHGQALLASRLGDLTKLGVTSAAGGLEGGSPASSLMGWPVLGLGYCGLVLLGQWQGKSVAVKLLRPDAGRPSLWAEAQALQLANGVGVGPTYWTHSEGVLVMDWVRGDRLIDWLDHKLLTVPTPTVQAVLLQLADASFRLDQLGLDHGELNCMASHGIVKGDRATIIDFSRASTQRRVSNVTALIQGLLIGTRLPQLLARRFLPLERSETIACLQAYKRDPCLEHFEAVRSRLVLQDLSRSQQSQLKHPL